MARKRFLDIDKSKGIAIFLVVLGHITLSGGPPRGAEWFEWLRIAVYKFHMPFFMYLSGYTLYYTLPKIESIQEYWQFIKKKALRLLPPLLLFGIFIGIGKYLMQSHIEVDRVPPFSWYEFLKIIIEPMDSFARSIWYIYVLFEFYVTIPLLLKATNFKLILLIIIGLLIHFFRPTEYFAFASYNEYFLYFVLGMVSVKYRKETLQLFSKFRVIFCILFVSSFYLITLNMSGELSKTIISLFSILALHSLMMTKLFDKNSQILLFAKYTFVIYLLNTVVIGLTKGVIIRYFVWEGNWFILSGTIIFLLGLYGPIFIKKFIFRLKTFSYFDEITN